MKLKNAFSLARLNLKGTKRKKIIIIMMSLSVVCITVLAGFLNLTNDILQQQKSKLLFRQVAVYPELAPPQTYKGVNEKTMDEILSVDHVIDSEFKQFEEYQLVSIEAIEDENGNDVTSSPEFDIDEINEGMGAVVADKELFTKSISGQQLEDAPVMSCLVPDYPQKYIADSSRYEKFDPGPLLGKTLTINCDYSLRLFQKSELGGYTDDFYDVANITYKLKVVGVYHYSNETAIYGSPYIIISPETVTAIENMALSKAQEEGVVDVSDYIDDPYARELLLTVDSYENVPYVENKLTELGYFAASTGSLYQDVEYYSSYFSGAATFLLGAVMLLTVVMLFLSVHNSISSRKGQIGLMKALGYKTSQIFLSMYLENVITAFKALLVGGAISALAVFTINMLNTNSGDTFLFSYVLPWSDFAILLVIALAVILIIPLICQLIMINMIAKIQPQEAMNS